MSDQDDSPSSIGEQSNYDVQTQAVSSNYKVLGYNKATSGTPYGVLGQVDDASGFGLYTPDDGKVDGTLATTGSHRITVDGNRVLEMGGESGYDPGNIVGGHSLNTVKDGAFGTVLLGGGQDDGSAGIDHRNIVTDNWGVVIGGRDNVAGSDADDDPTSAMFATVSGGEVNQAKANHATIGGGNANTAEGSKGTVGGGSNNQANGPGATVGGGTFNKALKTKATVSGGQSNAADAENATVGGGYVNSVSGKNATISGGKEGDVTNRGATIGGGEWSTVWGKFATIAGGGPADTGDVANTNNRVYDNYGTIGGGGDNRAGSDDGDTQDPSNDEYPTIAGGRQNRAKDGYTSIGGGFNNEASGSYATVAGGRNHECTFQDAAIGGGSGNKASNAGATVPGGYSNTASGASSFAAGKYAAAIDGNSFVWNDGSGAGDSSGSSSDQFSSSTGDGSSGVTGSNTFHVKSTDGVRIITDGSNNNVTWISGSSAGWSATSTRTVKTNVDPVNPASVLDRVGDLEVSTWEYRDEDGEGAGEVHMGPMAEDFNDAFDLGASGRSINSINADGVAFAAIQGLKAELEDRDERLEEQNARIEDLEAENADLRERLADIEAQLGEGGNAGTSTTPADD